jgi:hypothetical protein
VPLRHIRSMWQGHISSMDKDLVARPILASRRHREPCSIDLRS